MSVSPTSPQPVNSSLLIKVAISPSTAGGTVALYDGSTLLGSGSHYAALWSYATSSFTVGTHNLKATFTPDSPATYAASTTTLTDVVTGSSLVQPTPTATPTATTVSSCTLSAKMVPSCGVLWGSYKPPTSSETLLTAVTDIEAQAGRTFNIVYRYHDFSGRLFPDKSEVQLAGSGHILLEDWAPANWLTGAKYKWADIAAGKLDASVIDPEARQMKAYGKPVMLGFDHEMDISVGASGTAADYVAAYRHIHSQFAALGVTNVIWVWTTTGFSGRDWEFPSLYPGNSYVDWIGWDPYNFASCRSEGWKTYNQTIDPFYQWLEANGYGDKPFILPEFGTVQDPHDPSAAANWFSQIPAALAAHPNIKAALAWNDSAGKCDERIVGPGEMTAFGAAGRSSLLATHPT